MQEWPSMKIKPRNFEDSPSAKKWTPRKFPSCTVPQHISHQYTKEMSRRLKVAVLDILMKNEACHSDMVDIMKIMHSYLGSDYPSHRGVASGSDQLAFERQMGAQCHVMDGGTPWDRLQLLEPQTEDWHCLVCVLMMSLQRSR